MEERNLHYTFCIWIVLGVICMVFMLEFAAHKTVVIADNSQEQGETKSIEQIVKNSNVYELKFIKDESTKSVLKIPLEKGIKAENVTMENHYIDKELWIFIGGSDTEFYKGTTITGDLSFVSSGVCEVQKQGLLIKLVTDSVYEFHNTMDDRYLSVECICPRDIYERIVVVDPITIGTTEDEEVQELADSVSLQVVRRLPSQLEKQGVKLYFTKTDDVVVSSDAKLRFLEEVGADCYVGFGVAVNTETAVGETVGDKAAEWYGIEGLYNSTFYIPEFGNPELADVLTRNVTIATRNRAIGLRDVSENELLRKIRIPAAQLCIGNWYHDMERGLLQQEAYQEMLAEGIVAAIEEVYQTDEE